MRFEKQTDLQREMKAIKLFTDGFKGGFIKLGQNDIDFTILDANHTVIAYAEVKGRNKTMQDAFPLPIAVFSPLQSPPDYKHTFPSCLEHCP